MRRAVHLALDRQEIVAKALEGAGIPCAILDPKLAGPYALPLEEVNKIPGCRQPKDQDIAEAKRLVEKHYPNGVDVEAAVRSVGNYVDRAQLMLSQLIILFTISIYALRNLLVFDEAAFLAAITPDLRNLISGLGIPMDVFEQILRPAYFATYLIVIGVTLLFQGGMVLYYRSQRGRITEALANRPSEPPPLPRV